MEPAKQLVQALAQMTHPAHRVASSALGRAEMTHRLMMALLAHLLERNLIDPPALARACQAAGETLRFDTEGEPNEFSAKAQSSADQILGRTVDLLQQQPPNGSHFQTPA